MSEFTDTFEYDTTGIIGDAWRTAEWQIIGNRIDEDALAARGWVIANDLIMSPTFARFYAAIERKQRADDRRRRYGLRPIGPGRRGAGWRNQ